MFEGQLKTVSFLPASNAAYPQMPYSPISVREYDEYCGRLKKIDFSPVYAGSLGTGIDAAGERFCTTDVCEIKTAPGATEFEDEGATAPSRHS